MTARHKLERNDRQRTAKIIPAGMPGVGIIAGIEKMTRMTAVADDQKSIKQITLSDISRGETDQDLQEGMKSAAVARSMKAPAISGMNNTGFRYRALQGHLIVEHVFSCPLM